MSPSDFVFREIYTKLLCFGIPSDVAEKCANKSVSKYKKNIFTGRVVNFIFDEIKAAKKLYGAKNK